MTRFDTVRVSAPPEPVRGSGPASPFQGVVMRRLTGYIAGAAVLALALSACGSGDSATTGGGGGTSALKGTGTGDTCKITTPIPIGAVFSLTGAAASYGESQKKGLELAAEELKTRGGVTYDVK